MGKHHNNNNTKCLCAPDTVNFLGIFKHFVYNTVNVSFESYYHYYYSFYTHITHICLFACFMSIKIYSVSYGQLLLLFFHSLIINRDDSICLNVIFFVL